MNGRYCLIHSRMLTPKYWSARISASRTSWTVLFSESHSDYPTVVRNHNGASFLPISCWSVICPGCRWKGFPYEDAVAMCDVYAAAGRMGVHPL
ncbi:MAG: hypothetical protein V8R75_12040 [Oscillospiraceae bacterium]